MHQVAWKKPFARELEEKIQIGIDHDFIGHHNRRSGYYASNEQGMLRKQKKTITLLNYAISHIIKI